MVLNTSFNENEPIVLSPDEAINCFFENQNGFFSFRKLDDIKMKILHFVEEFSKKNSSVITVARYYSKIDKIDKKKGLLFCLKKN